jgi:hypothetical protein
MTRYLIFDCPGQVELYMHSDVMNKITAQLEKHLDLRLTCVHLIDCSLCLDLSRYLSAVLTSLTATMHLELPHVNVLSKIDLMKDFYSDLDFRLDYYLGVEDLKFVLEAIKNETEGVLTNGETEGHLTNGTNGDTEGVLSAEAGKEDGEEEKKSQEEEQKIQENEKSKNPTKNPPKNVPAKKPAKTPHPFMIKFRKFNEALIDMIEDYGLVRFDPLDVNDRESVLRIMMHCDQANGRLHCEKCANDLEEEEKKIEEEKKEREKLLSGEGTEGTDTNRTDTNNSSGTALQPPEPPKPKDYSLFNCVMNDHRHDYDDFIDRLQEKYCDPNFDEEGDGDGEGGRTEGTEGGAEGAEGMGSRYGYKGGAVGAVGGENELETEEERLMRELEMRYSMDHSMDNFEDFGG